MFDWRPPHTITTPLQRPLQSTQPLPRLKILDTLLQSFYTNSTITSTPTAYSRISIHNLQNHWSQAAIHPFNSLSFPLLLYSVFRTHTSPFLLNSSLRPYTVIILCTIIVQLRRGTLTCTLMTTKAYLFSLLHHGLPVSALSMQTIYSHCTGPRPGVRVSIWSTAWQRLYSLVRYRLLGCCITWDFAYFYNVSIGDMLIINDLNTGRSINHAPTQNAFPF